jgi:N utilization substance protein A
LAIGREGQNARLAAKLTGWRIDIKSETQIREIEAKKIFADLPEEVAAPAEPPLSEAPSTEMPELPAAAESEVGAAEPETVEAAPAEAGEPAHAEAVEGAPSGEAKVPEDAEQDRKEAGEPELVESESDA